jgi:hypothetical protein
LLLKVDLPRAEPRVSTVSALWPAASWHEREMYDLLGVHFVGHPTLRRLLLPEDWEGHPLRKDWQQPAHYQGMPTVRTYSNELYAEYTAELARSRPLHGLLLYDGEETRRTGEVLAARLKPADIDVELVAFGQADTARINGCDLLLIGILGKGLATTTADRVSIAQIERLPSLAGKPCAIYEVYTATAGNVLDRLSALLASKSGRLLGRGAVIAGRPTKDPDGLAAALVDAIRRGDIARPPAPPPPTPAPATHTAADSEKSPTGDEASHA